MKTHLPPPLFAPFSPAIVRLLLAKHNNYFYSRGVSLSLSLVNPRHRYLRTVPFLLNLSQPKVLVHVFDNAIECLTDSSLEPRRYPLRGRRGGTRPPRNIDDARNKVPGARSIFNRIAVVTNHLPFRIGFVLELVRPTMGRQRPAQLCNGMQFEIRSATLINTRGSGRMDAF